MLSSAPHRQWPAEDVAAALRIDAGWAAGQLNTLCDQGLARCAEGRVRTYQYRPRTDALGTAVAALADAYAERRVTVIGLIFAKPPETLRAFADAFRLRKDSGHGTERPNG